MDEQRLQACTQLIEKLLAATSQEKLIEILQQHRDLIDVDLIERIQFLATDWDRQEKGGGYSLWSLAQYLYLTQYIKISQPTQAQFHFLFEVLKIIKDGGTHEQVYPLLQQNLDKLDLRLAHALRIYVANMRANLEIEDYKFIGYEIHNFSFLIANFPLGNRANNIEIAIAGYQIILTIFTAINFSKDWATVQNNLGIAYSDRIKGIKANNLELSIAFYQNALSVHKRIDLPENWAETHINLSLAYTCRIRGDKADNLENAISSAENALCIFTETYLPEKWAATQNNLAIAYNYRLEGERADNLEKAIACFQNSLRVRTQTNYPYDWAKTQNNLAIAYQDRLRGDKADDLENAIFCFQNVLCVYTEETLPEEWARSQNNLGNVYLGRIRGKKAENLEKAITCFKNALRIRTETDFPSEWADTQNNLAIAYNYRLEGERAENLEKAITCFKNALRIRTETDFPFEWAAVQNNLGFVYTKRIKGERAENLEEAITYLQKALRIRTKTDFPSEWAESQNNLGVAYKNRIKGERTNNIEIAISNYQSVLENYSSQSNPFLCLTVASNLGYLLFQEENWQQAINAYITAIEAVEQTRLASTSDDRRQEIMEESIAVYENMVQACVILGQLETAIEYAERSRCRRLVDLMASNDLYSDGNIPQEVAKYLQQYYELQQGIDAARQSLKNDDSRLKLVDIDAIRGNRASYKAANEAIHRLEAEKQQVWQQIRSFDRVLSQQIQVEPISFDTICQLIPDEKTALICCYATINNLHIFVVYKNRPVRLHTTNLNRQQLAEFGINTWFNPYLNWLELQHRQSTESDDLQAWKGMMPETLSQLARQLKLSALVQDCLKGIEELIIIPHLYLHSIPFCALPIESSSHQFLGERFRLRILPSAQTLQFCHQRKNISWNIKGDKFGTVEDADGSLPFSQYEGEQITKIYEIPDENRLQGKGKATVANYRQLVKRVQVLHSSHHASSRLDNPLESHLQLADGKTISLGEIMSPGWRVPHLTDVFLSCCETNLGVARLSDEPLTLATGFLCAGARSVVSTLWSVDDLATAIFSIIYYRLRKDGLDRPTALQKAQSELKHISGKELEKNYYSDLNNYLTTQREQAKTNRKQAEKQLKQLSKGTPEYQQSAKDKSDWNQAEKKLSESTKRLKQIIKESRPFKHPYYWAGFVSQGLR